jgi:DNA-binding response OmpR family regulator/anti-sigma regulatory factor (Ser/Thr protein kinase)
VDALAPGLIHELRHPLLGLMAGTQMLERALGSALAGREEWALIKGQLGRLEELLSNYQAFLEPQAGAPEALALQPQVERALSLLAWRLRPLGARLERALPEAPLHVRATPAAITHALSNLLLNALDALEEAGALGTGRLAVRVLPADGAGRVQVRVSDEGRGVPPEVGARLFEPGFTTKAEGRGSGQGLHVARRMAEAVGGAVRLVARDDPQRLAWAVTEFVLELPAATAAGAAPPQPDASDVPSAPDVAAAPRAAPPAGGGPGAARPAPRVLVVEDEPVVALLARRALQRLGAEVTSAASAEEAEALLGAPGAFALLLTDKNLPGMDGVELARRARARDAGLRIALMTGYASAESAAALVEVGADAYLCKPFWLAELEAEVGRVLALPPRAAAPAPPGPSGRVLLAEPDAAARALVAQALGQLGRGVRTEEDLAGALAGPEVPAGVVVAASLIAAPGAAAPLQALRMRAPHVPVVVLAEAGVLRDAVAAVAVGALAQLHYPLAPRLLRATLEAALPGGAAAGGGGAR